MHGLIRKLQSAVCRYEMNTGVLVIVALSGGADSMALLNALLEIGIGNVTAAHINHNLRGAESLRDEEFVRRECARLNIPLSVFSEDVLAISHQSGEGVEETGRRIRYGRLAELAASCCGVIATAHTASDSVETVLLHMIRGCGTRGLGGIPPVRRLEGDSPVEVIRPLILCTRAEVEAYCTAREIPFVQDSTNKDTAYARNRLRHRIIPEMTVINPRATDAILRMAQQSAELTSMLDEQSKHLLKSAEMSDNYGGYVAEALSALSAPMQRHVLAYAAARDGGHICDSHQIELMQEILANGGSVTLRRNVSARCSQGRFRISKTESRAISNETEVIPGKNCAFYQKKLTANILSLSEYENRIKIHKNLLKNSFSYDNIEGKLIARAKTPGDFYRPVGRGVSKTLKKMFCEAKLPPEQRSSIPVLCDEKGIVLVYGFGCDERAKVTAETKQVLVLSYE